MIWFDYLSEKVAAGSARGSRRHYKDHYDYTSKLNNIHLAVWVEKIAFANLAFLLVLERTSRQLSPWIAVV